MTDYGVDMRNAWEEWEANNPPGTRTLLDKYDIRKDDFTQYVRGIEWKYLDSLLRNGFRSLTFDGQARAVLFSPDGGCIAVLGHSNSKANHVEIFNAHSGALEQSLPLGSPVIISPETGIHPDDRTVNQDW